MKLITRAGGRRLAVLGAVLLAGAVFAWFTMIRMPGRSFTGALPPATERETALAAELAITVRALSEDIGARNVFAPHGYAQAAAYLESELRGAGYEPVRQVFDVQGVSCANISAELVGSRVPGEIIVVGAHYDSVMGSPAANDNASGCAAVLALARALRDASLDRTIRFVLFANEEPPFFQTDDMGSVRAAEASRAAGERIVAMLSLETIGCYLDEPGTQHYPPLVGAAYPSEGDFAAFVGGFRSRGLVRDAIGVFRASASFPSEGAALPGAVHGVSWSDHWAYARAGFPAIMVTDTAPFRDAHYHEATDTWDRLAYDRMARVIVGLESVVRALSAVER